MKKLFAIVFFTSFISILLFTQGMSNSVYDLIYSMNFDGAIAQIKKGADVNLQGKNGETPLQYAIKIDRNKEVIEVLLQYGAEVNPVLMQESDPPLFIAITESYDPDIVKLLVNAGSDINKTNKYGDTALSFGAGVYATNMPQKLQILINAGSDVNHKNENGETAMHHAAIAQSVENLQVLLKANADIKAIDNEGNTPLLFASQSPIISLDIVEVLLNARSNINIQNKKGETALMLISKFSRYPEIIELLLKSGADVKIEDNTGRTVLDYIDMNKNRSVRESPVRKQLKAAVGK